MSDPTQNKPDASNPVETVKSFTMGQPVMFAGTLGLGAAPIFMLLDELMDGPKPDGPAPATPGGPDLASAPKPPGM